MNRCCKIAVIFYNIGPYHHARLNAATELAPIVGFEWSAQQIDPWGQAASPAQYQKISLFRAATQESIKKSELRQELSAALTRIKPDVMAVNGWNDFGSVVTLSCCLDFEIPLIVMSESTAHDEPRVWWKEFVKRRIVNLYSTALVGGRLHSEYLQQLGMSADRIFTGYDVVDNEHFAVPNDSSTPHPDPLPNRGGERNYFLASARFIPKKNLDTLLRAYAAYRNTVGGTAWNLVLLGDGLLKSDLRSLIAELRLDDSVALPGFKQYDELPAYYAKAGAFVHASTTEQWGLVVNEAIAAGLPVIVSNRCGCAPELVHEGVNGFTFDPLNESELTTRLVEMSKLSAERRCAFGKASRQLAARFGPKNFGRGLKSAAQLATTLPPKRGKAFDRFLLQRLLHR